MIVTLPDLYLVTMPLASTEAMQGSLEVQMISPVAPEGATVAVILYVLPHFQACWTWMVSMRTEGMTLTS